MAARRRRRHLSLGEWLSCRSERPRGRQAIRPSVVHLVSLPVADLPIRSNFMNSGAPLSRGFNFFERLFQTGTSFAQVHGEFLDRAGRCIEFPIDRPSHQIGVRSRDADARRSSVGLAQRPTAQMRGLTRQSTRIGSQPHANDLGTALGSGDSCRHAYVYSYEYAQADALALCCILSKRCCCHRPIPSSNSSSRGTSADISRVTASMARASLQSPPVWCCRSALGVDRVR